MKKDILVIGLGHAGRRHAKILVGLGHNVYWFDPVAHATDDCGKRAYSLTGIWSVLDAVVVATPPAQHFVMAAQAISRGIPTLVEKPLCDRYLKAEALCDLADHTGAPLACGYQLRAHASLDRFVSQARKSERLDAVYRSEPWPESTYERDMLLECSHELDVIGRIMPNLRSAYKFCAGRYEKRYVFSDDKDPCRAVAVLSIEASTRIREYYRKLMATRKDRDALTWRFSHQDNEQAYIDQMVAFLRGNPYCTGRQALEALRLYELVK